MIILADNLDNRKILVSVDRSNDRGRLRFHSMKICSIFSYEMKLINNKYEVINKIKQNSIHTNLIHPKKFSFMI